jgi:copper chaperone CopZ
VTTTYKVAGMTCDHCIRAVTGELSKLATVTEVSVALDASHFSAVTVISGTPLDPASVAEAIDEAGYELVPS